MKGNFESHRNSRGDRIAIWLEIDAEFFAECVLGGMMPILSSRDHLVCMHDMSDTRYCPPALDDYAGHALWKGENAADSRFRVGIVDSAVAQAFVVQDFTQRNHLTLDSADHSIDIEIQQVPGRAEEMRRMLGDDLFSLNGHWFWFTMNEHSGPYTFPRARR